MGHAEYKKERQGNLKVWGKRTNLKHYWVEFENSAELPGNFYEHNIKEK